MKRLKVKSSNVASIGYDAKIKTLEIAFHDGAIYQYLEVPASIYNRLIKSKSPGKFVHTYIKGAYTAERI